MHDVYRRWRQIADSYTPAKALLGETWEFDFERFGDYYGRQRRNCIWLSTFASSSRTSSRSSWPPLSRARSPRAPEATAVWTASNHDVGRFPTRWCHDDERSIRAALVVLATLPGTLVLYYGDELGMSDVDVPVPRQVDVMSLAQPGRPSRDRGRTPMPWSGGKNAGFSSPSARPWLPIGEHTAASVQTEQEDPTSVLSLWRELARLRQDGLVANPGPLERVLLDDQVWAFRTGLTTTIANLSASQATREFPTGHAMTVLASTRPGRRGTEVAGKVDLAPWEALVVSDGPP